MIAPGLDQALERQGMIARGCAPAVEAAIEKGREIRAHPFARAMQSFSKSKHTKDLARQLHKAIRDQK